MVTVSINNLAPKTSSVNLTWPQNETAMDNRSESRYARYRVKAYHGRRIPYYNNAGATTQVLFLRLSGDVEANPGPSHESQALRNLSVVVARRLSRKTKMASGVWVVYPPFTSSARQ